MISTLGLIRVNEETGEELRGEDGLCIRCKPGEPGEFVGKIVKDHPVRDFHGYADTAATKKKIVTNVWSGGDMCFRSGDILGITAVLLNLGVIFTVWVIYYDTERVIWRSNIEFFLSWSFSLIKNG